MLKLRSELEGGFCFLLRDFIVMPPGSDDFSSWGDCLLFVVMFTKPCSFFRNVCHKIFAILSEIPGDNLLSRTFLFFSE